MENSDEKPAPRRVCHPEPGRCHRACGECLYARLPDKHATLWSLRRHGPQPERARPERWRRLTRFHAADDSRGRGNPALLLFAGPGAGRSWSGHGSDATMCTASVRQGEFRNGVHLPFASNRCKRVFLLCRPLQNGDRPAPKARRTRCKRATGTRWRTFAVEDVPCEFWPYREVRPRHPKGVRLACKASATLFS